MKSALKTIIAVVALSLVLGAHAQQQAPVEQTGDGKTWTVNIRNADIQAFINQVAEMTGKNFVVDPRVRARDVTVISNKPLTANEVYELFLSVLQVHGYAAVPSGEVIKIVTNTTAKQSNLPLTENAGSVDGEELITQVIGNLNEVLETVDGRRDELGHGAEVEFCERVVQLPPLPAAELHDDVVLEVVVRRAAPAVRAHVQLPAIDRAEQRAHRRVAAHRLDHIGAA